MLHGVKNGLHLLPNYLVCLLRFLEIALEEDRELALDSPALLLIGVLGNLDNHPNLESGPKFLPGFQIVACEIQPQLEGIKSFA